jgi:hypothetical protein
MCSLRQPEQMMSGSWKSGPLLRLGLPRDEDEGTARLRMERSAGRVLRCMREDDGWRGGAEGPGWDDGGAKGEEPARAAKDVPPRGVGTARVTVGAGAVGTVGLLELLPPPARLVAGRVT